ncbi:MAG: thermonuclease family protein, partial [Candidatus Omnitrophica bacterium]|nr:thermonuclease family protein [Candidatus Omnitrophota bacterium]
SRSPLAAIKGKAGVYRIVEIEEKLHWDRGFESYRQLLPQQAKGLKDGDIVRAKGADRFEKIRGGKRSDLYTYEAGLIRVIDADTFWMRIWTQRPEWRKEKLRLRAIDAPELSTPEGKAAKRFVEALFKKAQSVTVTTTKPDKYHRYLSDVYLKMPDGAEIFLNHHLLQTGRAVRMAKIPPSEWEKE